MEEQGGQKVGQGPRGKDGQTAADLGPLQSREGAPTAIYVEMQTSQERKLPGRNDLGDQAPGPS